MPKISVVIPVYGVEAYIERCARSLFEQTLDDMEFVFVNDCTPDNSIDVLVSTLNLYPQRKGQVIIINKEKNEGASYARKTGIEHATGEYIGFCDSDDWVDISMYKRLYEYAIKGGFEYVKCSHYVSDGIKTLSVNNVKFSSSPNKEEVLRKLICCRGADSVWDSITQRGVFQSNKFVFTQNPMLEDFVLSAQILEYSSSYGVVREPLYYYFQNPDSVCNTPSQESYIKRGKQASENIEWILGFIHSRYGNTFAKEEVILKNVPRRLIIPIMKESSNYPIWNSFFPGNTIPYLCSSFVTRKLKFQYLLVVLHLYPLFKRLK